MGSDMKSIGAVLALNLTWATRSWDRFPAKARTDKM